MENAQAKFPTGVGTRVDSGQRTCTHTRGQSFMSHRPPPRLVRVHATLHGFADKERTLELAPDARADDAPRALGIRPELVLVFRDQRPLPADEPLVEGDRIRILRVVSGG